MIYKKKNTQALIELESVEEADRIKNMAKKIGEVHDLRLKIQFTNKKFLIVNKNNEYECDFKKIQGPPGKKKFIKI